MHFCMALLTKDFPTDKMISSVLAPYNEDRWYDREDWSPDDETPVFLWDWYELGGRYGGQVKLRINKDDKKYDWGCYPKVSRFERLFRVAIFQKEMDTYFEPRIMRYLGIDDGFVRVDACAVADVIDPDVLAADCFGFFTDNGDVHTREEFNDDDLLYTKKAIEAVHEYQNGWISIIDCHD